MGSIDSRPLGRDQPGDGAKTIECALHILDLFTHTTPQWAIKEIARRMDLPYSTAYRYVSTMEKAGYLVRHDGTGKYRVGLSVIELAGVALNQLDVRVHALAHLDHLADVTGHNANLGILFQEDVLHIAFAVRSQVPRAYTVLGRRAVAHCTALGKVMLADLPFAEVRRLIEEVGWRSYTPKSVTTFPELEQALSEIRAHGYGIDRGERSLGTNCLAAPVRDSTGRVVAAISVTGPRERVTEERLEELIPVVKEHADLISYQLGYDEMLLYHSVPVG